MGERAVLWVMKKASVTIYVGERGALSEGGLHLGCVSIILLVKPRGRVGAHSKRQFIPGSVTATLSEQELI